MRRHLLVWTGLMDIEKLRLEATELDTVTEPLLFLDEFFYDRV